MVIETRESEMKRLRAEQYKTRQDEVYGGLSFAEQAEYNRKSDRIHELEREIQTSAVRSSRHAEHERQWNKESETDTPQGEARQPYRNREIDMTGASDLSRQKHKNGARDKGRE